MGKKIIPSVGFSDVNTELDTNKGNEVNSIEDSDKGNILNSIQSSALCTTLNNKKDTIQGTKQNSSNNNEQDIKQTPSKLTFQIPSKHEPFSKRLVANVTPSQKAFVQKMSKKFENESAFVRFMLDRFMEDIDFKEGN